MNKFKVGDRVVAAEDIGWASIDKGVEGTVIKVGGGNISLIRLDNGREFRTADSRFKLVKGSNMDAIKLDVGAIKKRVLERAVVVKHCGILHVVVPLIKEIYVNGTWCGYYSLLTGDPVNLYGKTLDWIIRPGDECEFSDNGKTWSRGVYRGLDCEIFDGQGYPFNVHNGHEEDCYRFVRPVQTDPEKEARMKRIKNLEKELKELKQIEGMK